jgi:hypothetical protein
MSQPSNTYRLVRYDAANMIVTADFIRAESDDEALAKAEASSGICELWHGNRLVAQIDGFRQQA